MIERARELAGRAVDNAALEIFRIAFGLLMAFGALRFIAQGWVHELYGKPRFFFKFYGFEWFPNPGPQLMLAAELVLAALALGIALGLMTRLCAALYAALFWATQLVDVTNYLNHYVLVALLAALLSAMPVGRRWSLDARIWPQHARRDAPIWTLWALRAQFGCVWFFAGLAKLNPDWLFHAQPLGIWLSARDELPFIGALFREPWVLLLMSWGSCIYDLSLPFALAHSRSRSFAFVALLGFHALTAVFFDIGLFPYLMTLGGLLYFSPSWPLTWSKTEPPAAPAVRDAPPSRALLIGLCSLALFEVLVPLRCFLYPGSVLWHEQGMRFAWKVMLREKNGSVTYRLRRRGQPGSHEWQVNPLSLLEWRQYKEFSGQPDMIWQLAQHIAASHRAQGLDVEVRVDAQVSLNGRPNAPLIDPEVDLTQIRDGHWRADWITPLPATEPLASGRRARGS